MTRVFSAVVAISVAVLLISLVAACLWPQHSVEPHLEAADTAAPMAHPPETAAAPGQPTLAPPRAEQPVSGSQPEQGVVYATVEVEVNGTRGR